MAELFINKLAKSSGLQLKTKQSRKDRRNGIFFKINSTKDSTIGAEGYNLLVDSKKVIISANTKSGLFYGLQSFKQLLPPAIESDTVVENVEWSAQNVKITDYPKFKWRGMMLDVSRHFFGVDQIKDYLDQLAAYKYNVFHWHLTDDQGWRIEIKKYPKLTEKGAWRNASPAGYHAESTPKDHKYGGYYTQEEIKEVVAYAKKLHIDVLPEIEMPGHSQAAIAAYPELGCTDDTVEVWTSWGVSRNIYCPKEKTFEFLEDVIDEVTALFPFKYIHVGGDEAPKKQWKESTVAQDLLKELDLEDENELQSYFITRMEKYINSKGKKVIGWDEILEGGLAPGATVLSWRGVNGGVQATQEGHQAIMAPYGQAYLSQVQGDPLLEPQGPQSRTRLKASYNTDILPEGADEDLIIGGEAALWTEWVPNFRHAEYMTWPRALATAEVFWGTTTDWRDFVNRVETHFKYLDFAQTNYAPSMFDPIVSASYEGDNLKVKLSTEIPGLTLYYTFDGTNPDSFYPKYKDHALSVPETASEIRVVTYRNGQQIGKQLKVSKEILEKRARK